MSKADNKELEDYIEKEKIRELIKNKLFDICEVKLVRVSDLEELLKGK